jgi:hypothetical protein
MTRPTEYTDDLGLSICARIANEERLAQICADDDMPERDVAAGWMQDGAHDSFVSKVLWAMEQRTNNAIVRDGGRRTEIALWDKMSASAAVDDFRWQAARRADGTFDDGYRRAKADHGEAEIERLYRAPLLPIADRA